MSATLLQNASPATTSSATSRSSRARLAGRILTGLAVAFLTFDTVIKLAGMPQAIDGTTQLGYPAELVPVIGVIEAILLVLYLIPRTAPLGALLWTGYLGGAVATHFRVESPLVSHTLFPIYVAALIWGGLYLRDARVRALLGKR